MDRQIIYPGQIAVETDLLNTNRNTMIAIGKLAGALFGTGGVTNGLVVGPSSPAALTVDVAPGEIYQLENVDNTAYSSLPADTTDAILKQGIMLAKQTLACAAPSTTGYSINYLIQATYQDSDTGAVALPYYNASNPAQAYSGPNNTGATQATKRAGIVVVSAKAGTAATTGTQTTPSPDSGYIALASVTVANGQATITSGNITAIAPATPPMLDTSAIYADLASTASGKGASLIGFQQAGTGAVYRTLQSKEAEHVSLNDFGATGFTAMSAAVAAVKAAGGGSVKLPNGTQNTPVPGNYWGGVMQAGDIGGVLLEYDGPNVPVSMFFEEYGTNYISQKVFRFYENQAHAGFGYSAMHIENVAYGTGTSGPTNADFGLSISLKKLNTNTGTARAGELDGAYIGVRNDGSNSDTTALLLDVGNYGAGFNCAFEANITYFFGGVADLVMDVQCGVIDSRTNNQYGLVLAAQKGTLGCGVLLQSLAGANWTNFIVGAFNQINTYLVKSNGQTYLTTTDGTKNVSHGIDPSTGAYIVNTASDSLRIFTLDQSGNLSLGGYVNVGGTNIIGAPAATATAGAATLPANPVGFITISRSSTTYKIPYYAN